MSFKSACLWLRLTQLTETFFSDYWAEVRLLLFAIHQPAFSEQHLEMKKVRSLYCKNNEASTLSYFKVVRHVVLASLFQRPSTQNCCENFMSCWFGTSAISGNTRKGLSQHPKMTSVSNGETLFSESFLALQGSDTIVFSLKSAR